MIDGEREEFENAEPAVEVENPVESADDENEAPAEGDNAANAEPAKNAEGSADGEFRNDSEAAENGETGAQVEKFASTYMKKRDAITEALPVEVYRNEEDGRLVREVTHWLCDFDDSFAYVERSDWSRDNGYIERHVGHLITDAGSDVGTQCIRQGIHLRGVTLRQFCVVATAGNEHRSNCYGKNASFHLFSYV